MPRICVAHLYSHLVLVVALTLTIPAAYAAPQDNPAVASGGNSACADVGVYIFVGGTGGFDGLQNGGQFTELLQTGHVGLYEHNNAVVAAEHPPSIIRAIESVFTETGPGQAELGQVGANYFTLPPSYGYYQAVYIQNGLHPSEANIDTPSDGVPPGQLQKALKLWREYVDAARTAGIETVARSWGRTMLANQSRETTFLLLTPTTRLSAVRRFMVRPSPSMFRPTSS